MKLTAATANGSIHFDTDDITTIEERPCVSLRRDDGTKYEQPCCAVTFRNGHGALIHGTLESLTKPGSKAKAN